MPINAQIGSDLRLTPEQNAALEMQFDAWLLKHTTQGKRIEALEAGLVLLRAALGVVEWTGSMGGQCANPSCARYKRQGHTTDCIVGLALGRRR